MLRLIYNAIMWGYDKAALVAGAVSPKARLWHIGRRTQRRKLQKTFTEHYKQPDAKPVIWFHCASLGEFEQGRPVMEACRKDFPGHKILLTFFSPSGYEIRKNYPIADFVFYLPTDTLANARSFVALTKPRLAVFVKYEFWFNYLQVLHENGIPVLTFSAIFRPGQAFFKPYGKWMKMHLLRLDTIFVQDGESLELLKRHGFTNALISGDTRFDRVTEIAGQAKEIAPIDAFSNGHRTIVAGSTWPRDEELLFAAAGEFPYKLVITPHQIDEAHLDQIGAQATGKHIRFTEAETLSGDEEVLIVDTIGMLSSIYRYGQVAYIGGGFGRGIHNILEAAVYGLPVIFGPNYGKFKEAVDLIGRGGAFTFSTAGELKAILHLLEEPETYRRASEIAKNYVAENTGATRVIMQRIGELLHGN